MSPGSSHRRRAGVALVAIACCVVLVRAFPVAAAEAAPMLEYTLVHHLLEHNDPVPLLRVYADGLVRVHYPVYMARAGDYTLRLSLKETHDLLSEVAGQGLLGIDLKQATEQRRQAQGTALYHVSDVTETVIRVRLDDGDERGAGLPPGAIDATVRWPNVYTDRRRYPDLAPVATIDAAERRLRSLLERPELKQGPP